MPSWDERSEWVDWLEIIEGGGQEPQQPQSSAEKQPQTAHMSNLEGVVLLNTPLADFVTQNAL